MAKQGTPQTETHQGRITAVAWGRYQWRSFYPSDCADHQPGRAPGPTKCSVHGSNRCRPRKSKHESALLPPLQPWLCYHQIAQRWLKLWKHFSGRVQQRETVKARTFEEASEAVRALCDPLLWWMACMYMGLHDLEMWEHRHDGEHVQARIQEICLRVRLTQDSSGSTGKKWEGSSGRPSPKLRMAPAHCSPIASSIAV